MKVDIDFSVKIRRVMIGNVVIWGDRLWISRTIRGSNAIRDLTIQNHTEVAWYQLKTNSVVKIDVNTLWVDDEKLVVTTRSGKTLEEEVRELVELSEDG